jgi:hypothetical protein
MATRKGRHEVGEFDKLVSPMGEDEAMTPVYSPSRTVNGAKGQPRGQASQTAFAKDERRQGR